WAVRDGEHDGEDTMSTAGVMTMSGTTARDAEFEQWLHARQPALMRTAWALTGNPHDAADLLQTSLAKVYLSWDRGTRADSIDAYARRILVNEHTSLWRRAFKKREYATDTLPEVATSDRHDEGESRLLWEFVQTLSPKQRAVVVLRYYEELSEAETADVLGVSVGTVKSQCSRALASLRSRAPEALAQLSPEEDR